MSRLLLCIDDTDDVSKEISTGSIAEMIAEMMRSLGMRIVDGVTRHQLLLCEEIAYTSHNSSMCILGEGSREQITTCVRRAEQLLIRYAVVGANPGLASCVWEDLSLYQEKTLIDFGKRAKRTVLSIEEALHIADVCKVSLDTYGGDGTGQIGALAGIGLRLSGNDGTFRGKVSFGIPGEICTCKELKEAMGLQAVRRLDGILLADGEQICLKKQMKFALLDHKKVLVVKPSQNQIWEVCQHAELYEKTRETLIRHCCEHFLQDNDVEEQLDSQPGCWNCLYRRWTADKVECMY